MKRRWSWVLVCSAVWWLVVTVALAGSRDKLYFLDETAGPADSIWRVNLDGTGKEKLLQGQAGASTNLGHAVSLAVQRSAPGYVYTAETYNNYRLGRANLDGSGFTALRSGGNNYYALALDPGNRKIYFRYNSSICRVNLDGTGIEVLVSVANPAAIALDLANNKMYWTESVQIKSANLDGTGVMVILSDDVALSGIGLDIPNGKMYWARTTAAPDYLGSVKRANLDGSSAQALFTGAKFVDLGPLALNLNNRSIYFKNGPGTVSVIPMDGGSVSNLVTGQTLITALSLYVLPPAGTIVSIQ